MDLKAIIEASKEDVQQHGVKGQKWGVRRVIDAATGRVRSTVKSEMDTGLVKRTSSADQIAQDRIAAKIKTVGPGALSNKDIQDYTRRLQLHKDLSRVLAEQDAATKAKSDGFVKRFVKQQGGRQVDRVVNKALDVAVEQALTKAGIHASKSNPELGKNIGEVASRLAPKKKGK